MYILNGKRPRPLQVMNITACAVLAAAVFSACGGSSGDNPITPVNPGPVVSPTPAPPVTCTAQQYAAAWDSLACPEGMLCIGEVFGTDVANISVLTRGNRPDWSPDGGQLVFERPQFLNPDGGGVFRIAADGSGEVKLAEGREPAWSPDGGKIAFRNGAGIAVMDADGSNVTTLIRHDFASAYGAGVSAPAWSPDSQRIVFVDHGDLEFTPPQLYSMDKDGNDVRVLTQNPGGRNIRDPAWSPDGGSIVFIRNTALEVIDAGGGHTTIIFRDIMATSPYWSQTSDWTPDGSTIAFSTQSECTARGIATIGFQGGTANHLVAGAQQPAWSPDGSRLAFASAADAYVAGSRPARVYDLEGLHSFGSRSRFVLYDDGEFELQYSSLRWGTTIYAGLYRGILESIRFTFNDRSTAGPYTATGVLDGNRLTVEYNTVAGLADFEDGVYVLREAQQ